LPIADASAAASANNTAMSAFVTGHLLTDRRFDPNQLFHATVLSFVMKPYSARRS
jgi:hypothetical protein